MREGEDGCTARIMTESYLPDEQKEKSRMNEEFYRHSTVTGKSYNVFDCIKILNIYQAIYYMEHEVYPVDILISEDRKTKKKCLVFYFIRSETKIPYDEWCKNNGLYKKGD